MAHKRMFSRDITESDAFADMPLSTQALYFHLGMNADDDGFVNNAKKVQRGIGASEDDLRLLLAKRFLIAFESGVVVVKHWWINNSVRKDRKHATKHVEEAAMLALKDNGAYTLAKTAVDLVAQPTANQLPTKCQPNDTLDIDIAIDIAKASTSKDVLSGKPDFAESVAEIVRHLNERTGSSFKASTDKTRRLVKARLGEGFTVDDFKTVIDVKAGEWLGGDMEKYLRPETLFGTKFEGYLQERKGVPPNDRWAKYER